MMKYPNKTPLDNDLIRCHEDYRQRHETLKRQMLSSLPVTPPQTLSLKRERFVRAVVSVAAVLLVGVGLFTLNRVNHVSVSPVQTAVADVAQHIGTVSSIYFEMLTPSDGNSENALKMWWEGPNKFRMEMAGRVIMTGNSTERCIYNVQRDSLRVMDADMPGLEGVVLSELGGLFTSDMQLSGKNWFETSKVIDTEEISYRGEKCFRVTAELDGDRYVYIMDQDASKAQLPLYEVNVYRQGQLDEPKCRIMVREMNRDYPDSLFTIEPGADAVVK